MKNKLVADAERILGISISTAPSGRHYYYAAETSAYYWVTSEDMRYAREVAEYARAVAEQYPSDAYGQWCATTRERKMSSATAKRLGLGLT